jgi:hypothetical protein
MLGLATNLAKGGASLLTYVKDNLKLYLDFTSNKSDTLKFPCEGSTSFDGTDDYIDCGSDSTLDQVFVGGGTLTAWIKPSSDGENNYGRIFDKSTATSGADGFYFLVTDESSGNCELRFAHGFDSTVGFWDSTATVALNTWNHVAVVYDNSSTSNDPIFYINGVSVTVTEGGTPAGTVANDSSQTLFIGNNTGNARTFDGSIANAGIWSRALSVEEINSVMRKNYSQLKSVEKTSLVSWWALDNETESSRTPVESNARTETGTTEADSIILNEHGTTDYTEILSSTTFTSQGNWVNANGTHSYGNTEQYSEGALKLGVGYVHLTTSGAGFSTALVTGSLYKIEFEWTIVDTSHVQDIWFGIDNTYGGYGLWRRHGYNTDSTPEASQKVTFYHQHDGGGFFYFRNGSASNEVHIKSISCKLISNNAGIIEGATTTTSVYGGHAPVLPRAVDVAREGEAEAIGNGSASFDGTDDYIQVDSSNFPNLEPYTITAWFKSTDLDQTQSIIEWGDQSNYERRSMIIYNGGGGSDWTIVPSIYAENPQGGTTLTEGEWTHGAVTVTPSTKAYKIYVNGILDGSGTMSNTFVSFSGTSGYIGKTGTAGEFFEGNISQVGIWYGELTQAQIQSVMESTSYAKIPADVKSTIGSELFDADASTFDSGTHSWVVYGSNTIANDSGALKITYVDDVRGAYLWFKDASDLSSDLTVGKLYRLTFDAKVNSGSSVDVSANASSVVGATVTETSFTSKSIDFVCSATTSNYLNVLSMGSGEIVWIDNLSLKEVTNEIAGYWALDDNNSSKLPDFNGSNNYVNLGRINLYQGAFSCSYWVYHDTNDGTKGHFILPYDESSWSSPYARWLMRTINPGALLTYTGSWGSGTQINSSMSTGEWIHIVYTHDGTTSSGSNIWINGSKELTYSSSQATLTDDGSSVYMGTSYGIYDNSSEMMDGFIHNVAFMTSAVISDANIASIYALGKDGDFRTVLTPNHYYNHNISAWASGSGAIPDIVGDKNGTLSGTAQTLTAYKVNDLTDNNNDGELK